ncbi:BQ2448_6171 [Microbotryum intermedium]|uniref:H/ACA ribonucleoprotein complex subunit 2 n=1 Tax=Microbotryum intermedium TaxID=269621 RepID=A0A238FNJ2_9BASI|nr:BQ2448_6171 [Microbotryum intermedium]
MGKRSAKVLEEGAAAVSATGDVSMDVDAAASPRKSKKSKKDKESKDKDDDKEVAVELLSPIARPLAQKKAGKHVLKLVKKASKSRHLKRGVKEVVKSIRKGEKGIVVLAADISPLDILTHLPLLAEEASCPYVWVTSKEALGAASSTKRPTSCVMVAKLGMKKKLKAGESEKESAKEAEAEFQETYGEVETEIKQLDETVPLY